jgi:hypothetical protein
LTSRLDFSGLFQWNSLLIASAGSLGTLNNVLDTFSIAHSHASSWDAALIVGSGEFSEAEVLESLRCFLACANTWFQSNAG